MAMTLSYHGPLIKTGDAKRNPPMQKKIKGTMTTYERLLRAVAREVGRIIRGYDEDEVLQPTTGAQLRQALTSYSEILSPWANKVSGDMLRSVNRQDEFAWRQHTRQMSAGIRKELNNAPIGDTFRDLMNQNVLLIKSIPLEAARRVHDLIMANMMQSARPDVVARKIMETEGVTKSRATLIARTEISKASTAFTQARATFIGSDGYIWRTSNDRLVRKSHKEMNGKFVRWDSPVTLDNMTGHAGGFPNCRCYTDPVLPED